MKNGILIVLAASLIAAAPALASDRADIEAVLKQWISAEGGSAATCADDAAVVDDIPPFEWRGPGACSRWQKDEDAAMQQGGMTDASATMGKPQQLTIAGDRAYVVAPTTFSFTQKGKRLTQIATSTLVLRKTPAGWRIIAWTWATRSTK